MATDRAFATSFAGLLLSPFEHRRPPCGWCPPLFSVFGWGIPDYADGQSSVFIVQCPGYPR
eukprot:6932671-Prorocentrum_lima.AAC.1